MRPTRKLNRRSFLAVVIGGAVATGAAAVMGRNAWPGVAANGITDSDTGQLADAATLGRGTPRGYTDHDAAPMRDAQAAGRGPGARSHGRAAMGRQPMPTAASVRAPVSSGCSDADMGAVADAGGQGRACANRRS
jgi:hypothetical protein